MNNSNLSNENLQVATFDPAVTYAGASSLMLSESEMKALSAPFDDLDYEITTEGFIYLPQALSLQRLNTVIGVGQWGLLLINKGSQEITPTRYKVFYDGALVIRKCFVSRAAGEASYSTTNGNQSYATALEGAKTDCRQRCGKDLGIATDAWNPSFIRRWKKEHAILVYIKDGKGNTQTAWRRKDLDPFYNETGLVPNTPTVPNNQPDNPTKEELPWLNDGPEYDQALKEMLDGKTISSLRKTWKINKEKTAAMIEVLQKEWDLRLSTCNDLPTLSKSFSDNSAEVQEYEWLKNKFTARKNAITSGKVKSVAV